MRIVPLEKLTPGFVIGRPLTDENGRILLNSGVKLTEEYIRALRSKGYTQLFVQDEESGCDAEPEEDISPVLRSRAVTALKESFAAIQQELASLKLSSTADVSAALDSDAVRSLMSSRGPLARMNDLVAKILDEVLTRSTLAGLTSLKCADSQLYEHSIDVCIVSIMIGQAVGLTGTRLRQLATGAILHDIGAIFLEKDLPERTRVRQHTLLGYELLKASDDPDILAPHVALEHHEHQDGSGQPRGLIGSNRIERNRGGKGPVPTLVGEITAVANIYDRLMSGAPGQPALPPDQALQLIRESAGAQLNREVVGAFLRVVPVFPRGLEVLVRCARFQGYTGVVVEVNPLALDKPVVTLTRDNHGRLIEPITLDLSHEENVDVRCKTG